MTTVVPIERRSKVTSIFDVVKLAVGLFRNRLPFAGLMFFVRAEKRAAVLTWGSAACSQSKCSR